ncbi:GNAT family N-acetyltransferase, partial [Salmonella enterica]|nr:GNAT family N-acetyltransferase [Salmonella enterica]
MNPSNREVTIRRINGDGRAQWLALWQGYLDFYRADVAPQVTDRTFERLGQDEQVYGLVAEDADGRLLGLM